MPTKKTTKKPSPAAVDKPPKLSLEECVREYLSLAIKPPEKEPKTQRAQRENAMIIHGFNRAQETLRTIISTYGRTSKVREVADVRNPDQQKPMMIGNQKMWLL